MLWAAATPSDEENRLLRRLSDLTNVIPVFNKADKLSADSIESTKRELTERLCQIKAQPFLFGRDATEQLASADAALPPYAVSAAPTSDDDEMDASLLMSKDYRPPLHASDLELLVSRVFDPSMASWLRHAAAKKFVQWRKQQGAPLHLRAYPPPSLSMHAVHGRDLQAAYQASSVGTSSAYTASSVLANSTSESAVMVRHHHADRPQSPTWIPSYSLSRLADHTQRSERLAQVRLARWAADLEKALCNERERFARLQDAERQEWLRQRLGECVSPDADFEKGDRAVVAMGSGASRASYRGRVDPRDPLGLLAWDEQMRRRAVRAVRVLGGAGILSAVVMWCVRYVEWYGGVQGWWQEWAEERWSWRLW